MSKKQLIGLIVLALGVVLILFSLHAKGIIGSEVSKAEGQKTFWTTHPLSPLSNTPIVNDAVGNAWQGEIDRQSGEYYMKVQLMLYAGIAFVIIGGGLLFLGKRR
jgi:hypothetical protein